MAEDKRGGPQEKSPPDALALTAAMQSSDPKVNARLVAYLKDQSSLAKKQTELADLQIEDLKREDHLRHWSLIVHHISDVMKVTFELTAALIALALVVVVFAAVWSAAHDQGLVIDAFKVPPDMAQRGLTGDVVASQLLDRLTRLQAQTDSMRAPDTYSGDWGKDIKVEIPNTGVSVSEAYRYLSGWLGHQTHISGEIYRTANGIALTTRVSGNPGLHTEGRESELDAMLGRAAENVYLQTQPYRYAVYLSSTSRYKEEFAVLEDLALNGPDSEKAWAYSVWAFGAFDDDDMPTALARSHKALALAPDLPLALYQLVGMEAVAGHDEQVIHWAAETLRSIEGNGAREITPRSATISGLEMKTLLAEEAGSYGEALELYKRIGDAPDFEGAHWAMPYMVAADLARLHDVSASRNALRSATDLDLLKDSLTGYGDPYDFFELPQFQQSVTLGDWRAARKSIEATLATKAAADPTIRGAARRQIWPWAALADAKTGDTKEAWAQIGKTPLDCYLCLRARGDIDAQQKNWRGAEFWFAEAVRQAPSIPFAYVDWGAMLLAKGDFDGAIVKFEQANEKGPNFADPLEMWGEALMLKNRSDLALAEFEEANKYAPNWGHLHLEWGKALFYAGKLDAVTGQFTLAASLDLSQADKATLAKWMRKRS